MKGAIEESIVKRLNLADEALPGSEEQQILDESAVKLISALNEHDKIVSDYETNTLKNKIEVGKTIADIMTFLGLGALEMKSVNKELKMVDSGLLLTNESSKNAFKNLLNLPSKWLSKKK